MVPTCLCERAFVFIPLTLIYQGAISLSLVADYYLTSGQIDHYKYIYENKKASVIRVTLIHQFIQYVVLFVVSYFEAKIHLSLGQLAVAKESLRVTVNNLNEAIIIRTQEGIIGYCNAHGLKIVKSIA